MSKLKIALIGYGKMGHIIERIAKERGHEITCHIDVGDEAVYESKEFKDSDVAIEFTTPSTAVNNIFHCFACGVPVVCGTTGWLANLSEIKEMCVSGAGTLFYASNYSIGVNIFMAMNRFLANVMKDFPQYSPAITEIHHIHKLDHPSGTAITLAEDLIRQDPLIHQWKEAGSGEVIDKETLPIGHIREGETPGTHIITWTGADDSITIEHKAFSRDGFALGAVIAAEWVAGRKGFFTMKDLLGEKFKI